MASPKSEIKGTIDGKIDRGHTAYDAVVCPPKDQARFPVCLEALQDEVAWEDPTILPPGPQVVIVQCLPDQTWMSRSLAGHDFCEWDQNWKLHARIRVRETVGGWRTSIPPAAPSTDWLLIREWFCPVSGDPPDVGAPARWYPVIDDFEQDPRTFYRDWPGMEMPEGARLRRCRDTGTQDGREVALPLREAGSV